MYICVVTKVFCQSTSQLGLLQSLGILGHDKMVDAVLYLSVHEGRQIIDGVAYAMVGDASLRIVVGTYLGQIWVQEVQKVQWVQVRPIR